MILVDTSVLIDFLNSRRNKAVVKFEQILEDGMTFGICFHIYQEILQGAASGKDYKQMKRYLGSQIFYPLHNGRESYAEAARIYLDCRRAGYTVSSATDCLIARTAIENNLYLLHNDSDFGRIKKVTADLKIY